MSGKNKGKKKPSRGTQAYNIRKMIEQAEAYKVRNMLKPRKRKQK